MKTIFAFAAFAVASLGVASTAGAQTLSPYVGLEYITTPTTAGTGGATANTWWGGDATTEITVGATADLPWGLALDGSVGIENGTNKISVPSTDSTYDASALDIGGFGIGGADLTLSKEVMSGLEIYTTTKFDNAFARESTSVGAIWRF